MKKDCPKCNGSGSVIVDYKTCEACGGTGYEDDMYDVGSHFKGVAGKARDKFDLGSDTDIPCEVCNGKGQVPVYDKCTFCGGKGTINVCSKCGKQINEGSDICDDCKEKEKQRSPLLEDVREFGNFYIRAIRWHPVFS